MKKLALVAAVAAALPVLAHADVTIYGTVAMGINSYDNAGLTTTRVDDYGSKIGFKGSEDLGNGLKSIWQIESGYDADGSQAGYTGTFASRTTWVGLQSGFGTVRLGRLWDMMVETESTDTFNGPHVDAHNLTYPVYENGIIPGFNLGGGVDAGSGIKNAVRYDAPSWNGVDVSVLYAAGENNTTTTSSTDRYGFHVNYQNEPTKLFVGVAYEAQRNQAGSKTGAMSRIEGGYNGDKLTLAATFNHDSLYASTTSSSTWNTLGANNSASHFSGNSWGLLAAYAIGPFTPKIEYSQRQDATVDGSKVSTNIKQIGLAVDYSLSKRTTVEAAYARQKEGDALVALNGDSSNTSHTVYFALIHKF
ncbi:porin [Paludibacterium yongneupense]|uniref:porin n=1 Tax=Paludibacterium yongneupense TaxID=400061 RepID=UPI00040921C1|nr:porin [Paludibacterium yongneupense]